MLLHFPFMGAGLYFEEEKINSKLNTQLLIMNLVASALATKVGHEINPEFKIGCMLAAGKYVC